MHIQRLRNLTTGVLHTEIAHVYADIEFLVGEPGIFTHMIPAAMCALTPWLRKRVTDETLWAVALYDDSERDYPLAPMDSVEQTEFWTEFLTAFAAPRVAQAQYASA